MSGRVLLITGAALVAVALLMSAATPLVAGAFNQSAPAGRNVQARPLPTDGQFGPGIGRHRPQPR